MRTRNCPLSMILLEYCSMSSKWVTVFSLSSFLSISNYVWLSLCDMILHKQGHTYKKGGEVRVLCQFFDRSIQCRSLRCHDRSECRFFGKCPMWSMLSTIFSIRSICTFYLEHRFSNEKLAFYRTTPLKKDIIYQCSNISCGSWGAGWIHFFRN